jgi:hypothetical protein
MAAKGTWNLPELKQYSTESARLAFHQMWGRDFYGSDEDIRSMCKQVPSSNQLLKHPIFGTSSRCDTLLWIMMEQGPAQPTIH